MSQVAAVRDGRWEQVDREDLAFRLELHANELVRDADIALRILIEASLEEDPLDAFDARDWLWLLTGDAPSVRSELERTYRDTYTRVLQTLAELDLGAVYPLEPPWSFAELIDPKSWQKTEQLPPDQVHWLISDVLCLVVVGALRPDVAPGWREHAAFLLDVVRKSFKRSMLVVRPWTAVEEGYRLPRQGSVMREIWRRARREAVERCDGRRRPVQEVLPHGLPMECPFDVEQLLARDADVDQLVQFFRSWVGLDPP